MKKIIVFALMAAAVTGCASGLASASSQGATSATPPISSPGPGTAAHPGCALESIVSPTVWVLFTVSGQNATGACSQAIADSGSWPPDGGDFTFTLAPGKDIAGAERQSSADCTIYTPPITTGNGIYLPPSSTGLTFEFYGSSEAGAQSICFGVAASIPGARSTDSLVI
jgi:hypothetical protein